MVRSLGASVTRQLRTVCGGITVPSTVTVAPVTSTDTMSPVYASEHVASLTAQPPGPVSVNDTVEPGLGTTSSAPGTPNTGLTVTGVSIALVVAVKAVSSAGVLVSV